MNYGYIRVSTKDQNTGRQEDALLSNDVLLENIYTDMQSGRDFMRPAYKKLMRKLKKGDLIVVKSIDRLGRNYAEILEQWRLITKEKMANIRVLDLPLLDTSTKPDDVTGTLISDIVLELLAYVAETERKMILQRQAEGIESAKARGVVFGRPEKSKPENYEEVFKAMEQPSVL